MVTLDEILAARDRIAPAAIVTPMVRLEPARLAALGVAKQQRSI